MPSDLIELKDITHSMLISIAPPTDVILYYVALLTNGTSLVCSTKDWGPLVDPEGEGSDPRNPTPFRQKFLSK
jgi:hypothetical protein